ncbi:LLM class flavin-dependent oxidoreductase [Cohnella rhizosphaerae]|uniref:LLM class flavin-dependent oxidoreductase n=1 Tax=Cohnella rhizosphaerae TaxID=1457232 RepID=A0A9X4QS00_9BACL|nr:LLM class flavin-dependent oxidoreductase [Cohnella rhizosphaerae]MDG0808784.1 LLM class flavin-dependent oxidoreductase [Cohnella rhizosphaerae]
MLSGGDAAQALRDTIELAALAERLGYSRFWVSEHHNAKGLAGASPEVLLAALGANTSRIRIGSGGVLLPHYSPYKVAENFRVLEGLYPGRIDLGIGRAPGGMPLVSRAMGREAGKDKEAGFVESLRELAAYLNIGPPLEAGHPLAGLEASPEIATRPEAWLLGSSAHSAQVASALGAGFAFAHFINGQGGQAATREYRRRFRAGPLGTAPRVAVCVYVVCMDDDGQAEREAASLDLRLLLNDKGEYGLPVPSREEARAYAYDVYDRARIAHNRSRMIVGGPERAKRSLYALAASYGADEIIVNGVTADAASRSASLARVAGLFRRRIGT